LFRIGPVPISNAVATTWAIMALLTLIAALGMRRPALESKGLQAILEIVVETVAGQISQIVNRDAWPFMPLVGTIFIFLVAANLSAIVPGLHPPTGHLETPAALGAIVFLSVHVFGFRARGIGGYLRHYIEPNPLMLPLNLLLELTRTFSLMVRLFGNMMSHEIVIAIVVFLAALFVPIPFMLLGMMIGIIQAYIFAVLAAVFIGAAVSATESNKKKDVPS